MKRIIFLIPLFFLFTFMLFGLEVNVIMKDGKLVKGTLIGSTEKEVFVEVTNGKVETLQKSGISQVFDAKTGKVLKEILGEETSQETIVSNTNISISITPIETIEPVQISEAIEVFKKKPAWYERTVKRYFMANLVITFTTTFSSYIGMGMGANVWVRPLDFLAIGGSVGIDLLSFSLQRENESLPTGNYGISIRFIPFSFAESEYSISEDFFLEYQYGTAYLVGILSEPHIADESINGNENYHLIAIGYRERTIEVAIAYRILKIYGYDLSGVVAYMSVVLY